MTQGQVAPAGSLAGNLASRQPGRDYGGLERSHFSLLPQATSAGCPEVTSLLRTKNCSSGWYDIGPYFVNISIFLFLYYPASSFSSVCWQPAAFGQKATNWPVECLETNLTHEVQTHIGTSSKADPHPTNVLEKLTHSWYTGGRQENVSQGLCVAEQCWKPPKHSHRRWRVPWTR